ncbi:MAG: OAM dimerization domain-containing protein [Myxococcales bacterium]
MSEKHLIRPYGDRKDDGVVQLSFVLPVPVSEKAKEAAAQVAKKLGLSHVLVSAMEKAGEDYSFFVVYGRTHMQLDYASIEVPVIEHRKHGFDELNDVIERDVGRKIVVVGACIGTDSHTTGIDAIMNMKGFAGDYGLERYRMFKAVNLGSQVEPHALVEKAKELQADAVLVSKVVTQRDVHKEDARNLIEAAKEAQIYQRTIWLFGGPRVDHKTALELGFDAGFGPGTKPSDVANYIYYRLLEREHRPPPAQPTAHGTPNATIELEERASPGTGGARRAQHRETKE